MEIGLDTFGELAPLPGGGWSEAAAEAAFPPSMTLLNRIARQRGFPPLDREGFDASRELRGADFVGSPAQVMRSIELLGTHVAPALRAALGTAAS